MKTKAPRIRLILDTSLLRSINPAGGVVRRLRDLSIEGTLQLIVPWIAKEELRTGVASDALRSTEKHLLRALDWASIGDKSLKRLSDGLKQRMEDIAGRVDIGLSTWLKDLNATIMGPGQDHLERVFRRYFDGTPPFKAAKERGDIPDAFIFECIQDAADQGTSQVHAVIKDKALREAANTISGVTTHHSIEDFIAATCELNPRWKKRLLEFSKGDQVVVDHIGYLIGREVLQERFHLEDEFGAHCTLEVNGSNNAKVVRAYWDRIGALGPSLGVVPVTAIVEVSAEVVSIQNTLFSRPWRGGSSGSGASMHRQDSLEAVSADLRIEATATLEGEQSDEKYILKSTSVEIDALTVLSYYGWRGHRSTVKLRPPKWASRRWIDPSEK